MITRRILIAGGPLAVGTLLAASVGAQPAEAAIHIDNFAFTPAELTIAAGTRVTWINRDDIPHNVVDRDNPRTRRSPVLDTNDSYAFTFESPGTFHYFCALHPHMQGTVIVR
ncbi:MAG TPA: cupredoxin family copper-binding protein [Roseomonas sp.]|jgi:amicyanin